MNGSWRFVLSVSLFFGLAVPVPAFAQAEGPPSEPPYTNEENEFFAPPPEDPAVVEAPPARPVKTPADGSSVQYIQHPQSKKGLYRIDADGSYHYVAARTAKKTQSSSLRLGTLNPAPGIETPDANNPTDYGTMYGGNPTMLLYDYEWQPLDAFGKLGVQAGFAYFSSTGQGRFLDCVPSPTTQCESREKYTFHALLLNLGVVYRLEFVERQWIAPYVSGGGSYAVLIETRDDNKAPKGVGTPVLYGGGGLMLNIGALDKEARFRLDAEYGIADLWLTLEARQFIATNKDLDISGTFLNIGISADY